MNICRNWILFGNLWIAGSLYKQLCRLGRECGCVGWGGNAIAFTTTRKRDPSWKDILVLNLRHSTTDNGGIDGCSYRGTRRKIAPLETWCCPTSTAMCSINHWNGRSRCSGYSAIASCWARGTGFTRWTRNPVKFGLPIWDWRRRRDPLWLYLATIRTHHGLWSFIENLGLFESMRGIIPGTSQLNLDVRVSPHPASDIL